MDLLSDLGPAFILGLLTPLGAVCVLPLYPGFLVYLTSQLAGREPGRATIILFGLVITSGVILFMLLLGLIFTTILEVSLTNIIGIVSPIAFGILLVISLLLIFNVDVGRFLPKARTPIARNPWASAFLFGFFFGAIVVPCNPLFIAALFTRAISATGFLENVLRFLFFGIGIGFPLLVLAAISSAATDAIINFLTKNRRIINLIAGTIMLGISLYYLIFVFRVFG
ncbi:MAG: cytochrome c biogenesis protein CcdA [Dehalococcoidales bacterium]